jgi:hypothetical protein
MGLGSDSGRVISFAFFRPIVNVEIEREAGSALKRNVRSLNAGQRSLIKVRNVGYVVARDRQPRCFDRLKSFNARGKLIESFSLSPCGP